METGFLQRMAGFFRDLKGASEWDGNERKKPCAVIGIPYSSDAAENTETKEEEDVMKNNAKYMFTAVAVAAAAVLLAACGGGGGTSSAGGTVGTAVVATGTMTKGSVIVNGVRFEDTLANITADDTPKTAAFLQTGMTVKVKGRRNDDGVTGTATEIEVENEVRGTVANKGVDSFTVLGQSVFVDGGTVFANVANFAALNNGDTVEVHGSRDSTGAIRATRVEKNPGTAGDELKGVVANKTGTTSGTFTITGSSTTFTYDNTSTALPNGMFAVGDLVEVHLSGTAATRVEIEDLEDDKFNPAQGQEFEVEGYVTAFTATPGTFQVGGQAVQTTSSTRYEGGLSTDLANDVKVEAEGHFRTSDSTLVADKIKFKDAVRFETNVESKDADSLNVLGREVQVTSKTKNGGLLATLNPGEGVRIRAFLNQDNTTFTATELASTNAVDPDRHIIQGLVISASSPTIVLVRQTGGFTVDTTGLSDVNFKDDNDASIGRAAFFSALKPGQTVVKARGSYSAGTLAANEVEIE